MGIYPQTSRYIALLTIQIIFEYQFKSLGGNSEQMLWSVSFYIGEKIMWAKLEKNIIENFGGIIFAFVIFWFTLIAYGLLNQ